MKVDSLTEDAIEASMRAGVPFACFALPGDEHFEFHASMPDDDGRSPAFSSEDKDCFFINFFDNDEPYTAGIPFDMDAAGVIDRLRVIQPAKPLSTPEIHPRVTATFRAAYHEAFIHVMARLKADGGKTVLSRIRSIFSVKPVMAIAGEYFAATSSTFRYLCYTPETGLWLGSTPELLLESDNAKGLVRTMALAGTRPAGRDGEWDSKNRSEHEVVTAYIKGVLADRGFDVKIGALSEKQFINVVHLFTPIEASGPTDVRALMTALSPTPAVAGFPADMAKEDISRYETHRRHCYGGYVGIRHGGDYHAYVNLRCAFMEKATFRNMEGMLANLYAGGGIMPDSDEESEWQEAAAKSSTLSKILLGEDGEWGTEGHSLSPRTVVSGKY